MNDYINLKFDNSSRQRCLSALVQGQRGDPLVVAAALLAVASHLVQFQVISMGILKEQEQLFISHCHVEGYLNADEQLNVESKDNREDIWFGYLQ